MVRGMAGLFTQWSVHSQDEEGIAWQTIVYKEILSPPFYFKIHPCCIITALLIFSGVLIFLSYFLFSVCVCVCVLCSRWSVVCLCWLLASVGLGVKCTSYIENLPPCLLVDVFRSPRELEVALSLFRDYNKPLSSFVYCFLVLARKLHQMVEGLKSNWKPV